ncbi:MAG: thiamine-phosphate kinase [Proteobacteria bacterium]|nr:thiamine-phosphate kinase [Pseudomonadota bacterium]
MSGSEFKIIQSYFSDPEQENRSDIILGIGDDCAIVAPRKTSQLAFSIDTLISGVHFPHNTPADAIAYKALAVNLSDLAAMGAEPAWFTLSLTLPGELSQNNWLGKFSQSLFSLAKQYHINLIGGDTTHGPLSITIQVAGYVEPDAAIKRSGAKVGDVIIVTGGLGTAAMGLDIALQQSADNYICLSDTEKKSALNALNYPKPRVIEGVNLRGIAHSAIDLSDGLYADLGHILKASNVAAELQLENIPLSDTLSCLNQEAAWEKALTGGDDYELCFTLSKDDWPQVSKMNPQFTAIGRIVSQQPDQNNLRLLKTNGEELMLHSRGYDHFG